MNVEPITRTRPDVEQLIRSVIDQNPNLQSPQAEVELQRPFLSVNAHAPSLVQCISNLLSNAVKFVTPGVIPRVKIWAEVVDGAVRICIKDNGIGIAHEHQKRIFEAFERLN